MRPRQLLQRLDRQHSRHMALPLLPRRPHRPTHESRPSPCQGLPTRGHLTNHHGQTENQRMTTTTGRGRSTAAYRNWVKQVLANSEPTCIRCGYPVDMTLPRTHPQGASADHEPPLAHTGDLTPGLDGSGIAHLHCNRSHGGKLGSKRATEKRKAKAKTKTQTGF